MCSACEYGSIGAVPNYSRRLDNAAASGDLLLQDTGALFDGHDSQPYQYNTRHTELPNVHIGQDLDHVEAGCKHAEPFGPFIPAVGSSYGLQPPAQGEHALCSFHNVQ